VLGQERLRIKRIDLGRAAIKVNVDDVFGPGREMRRLGRKRIARKVWRGEQTGVVHQAGEAEHAEAGAQAGEQLATSGKVHSAILRLAYPNASPLGRPLTFNPRTSPRSSAIAPARIAPTLSTLTPCQPVANRGIGMPPGLPPAPARGLAPVDRLPPPGDPPL